jgi:putative colanic acid biosynthesis acetyltransferase WcaB
VTATRVAEALRADWVANRRNPKSLLVLTGYRIAHFFAIRRAKQPIVWLLGWPAMAAYRLGVEWVLGVELSAKAHAGAGLVLWHGQGLVVHENVVLGARCVLRQNTTIGPKLQQGVNTSAPVLGDGVDVGANAVIVGPVKIGSGAVVGAGAVVTRDVPAGSVVAGNPARPIADRDEQACPPR